MKEAPSNRRARPATRVAARVDSNGWIQRKSEAWVAKKTTPLKAQMSADAFRDLQSKQLAARRAADAKRNYNKQQQIAAFFPHVGAGGVGV